MMSGLITELKKFAELVKESQPREIYGAPWTLVNQGRDPRQIGIVRLSTEAGGEGRESCGEKEEGGGGEVEEIKRCRELANRGENAGAEPQGGGQGAAGVGLGAGGRHFYTHG